MNKIPREVADGLIKDYEIMIDKINSALKSNLKDSINSMVEPEPEPKPEIKARDTVIYTRTDGGKYIGKVLDINYSNNTIVLDGMGRFALKDCTKVISIQLSGDPIEPGKMARLTKDYGGWEKGTEVLIYKKPSLGVTVWSCVKVGSQECQIVPESSLELL